MPDNGDQLARLDLEIEVFEKRFVFAVSKRHIFKNNASARMFDDLLDGILRFFFLRKYVEGPLGAGQGGLQTVGNHPQVDDRLHKQFRISEKRRDSAQCDGAARNENRADDADDGVADVADKTQNRADKARHELRQAA